MTSSPVTTCRRPRTGERDYDAADAIIAPVTERVDRADDRIVCLRVHPAGGHRRLWQSRSAHLDHGSGAKAIFGIDECDAGSGRASWPAWISGSGFYAPGLSLAGVGGDHLDRGAIA